MRTAEAGQVRPGGPDLAGGEPPGPLTAGPPPEEPDRLLEVPPPLRLATRAVVALLAAVAVLHVFFVFLHVAPPNQISQRYARQVESWVYPFFEQNWRLFAPEPESAVPQISVRTAYTSADGSRRIGDWLDLTAIDNAGVRHSVFPSHTHQNMLRRAWTVYLDLHGNSDVSSSDRAVMAQEYLRNIAVERIAAARHSAFTDVQLRVRTYPVPGYDATGHMLRTAPSTVDTRMLPWWKASDHDH
ncbi:DUF5819 family protein [Streptomyces polygonati]|uniref:DUF5819 family protein n=1 Tax=Streptomyces polygonati TaxID=1617087 RepID=A0ABV8HSC9_9ACTN